MNVLKKKTKCYIYTRVSTAIQVDGYSLDAQKDKLKKYAEFQDMEIVGEYSDEGHSGKNIKGRQEFMRMLNDICHNTWGESTIRGSQKVIVGKATYKAIREYIKEHHGAAVSILNIVQTKGKYGVDIGEAFYLL